MFKVKVQKCIWTHEPASVEESLSERSLVLGSEHEKPKVAILYLELELPFAPFIGLDIRGDGYDCRLASVRWNVMDKRFDSAVKDSFPGMELDSYISYEELMEFSLDEGWVRPQRGGGDAPRS